MFSYLSTILLFTIFSRFCLSERIELGTLQLHPPSHDPKDFIEVCNLHLNNNNDVLDVHLENLNTQETISYDEYCLSFKPIEGRDFHCFNYFQKSADIPLQGTIYLSFKVNTTLLDYITFTPDTSGKLSVRLIPSMKLGEPKPKFYSNNSKQKQPVEAQVFEEDREEIELEKEAEKLKDVLQFDASNRKDDKFQEIIPPRYIKADKKTFIERNWKYILLPSIFFIVIGNLALGD